MCVDSCGSYLIIVALYSDWRLLLAWLAMIGVMGVVIPLQLPFLQGEEVWTGGSNSGRHSAIARRARC